MTGMVSAQDVHFSQFDMSPLTLNPALTGAFQGTFRIGGIYRNQWAGVESVYSSEPLAMYGTVADKPYTTPSLYVDMPLIEGFGKNDWIGVGAVLYSDKTGALGLTTQAMLLSAAYHLGLDKKGKTQLTLGLQGGYMNRSMNDTDDQGNATGVDGTKAQLAVNDPSFVNTPGFAGLTNENNGIDLNAGVTLRTKLGKKSRSDLMLGFAINHLLRPKIGLVTADSARLAVRPNIHGKLDLYLTEKWSLSPAFMVNMMAKQRELAAQALVGYKLKPENDFKINFGLGYRLSDAPIILAGIDYKSFRVGGAYDITASDVQSLGGLVNGWEIAVSYIAIIFKDPVVPPSILCPRF